MNNLLIDEGLVKGEKVRTVFGKQPEKTEPAKAEAAPAAAAEPAAETKPAEATA